MSYNIPNFLPDKMHRNFLIYYINKKRSVSKKTSGNPNFFTWRIKSNNYTSQLSFLQKQGFVIYKIYYKAVNRLTGQTDRNECINTFTL